MLLHLGPARIGSPADAGRVETTVAGRPSRRVPGRFETESRTADRTAPRPREPIGAEPRAAELIAQGPPFAPAENGLTRHAVYLSAGEVVFVFEGHEVEWIVDGMIDDPF